MNPRSALTSILISESPFREKPQKNAQVLSSASATHRNTPAPVKHFVLVNKLFGGERGAGSGEGGGGAGALVQIVLPWSISSDR